MDKGGRFLRARMVKSADTADLKSVATKVAWGFKSPSGHHIINNLRAIRCSHLVANFSASGCFGGCSLLTASCYALDH